MGKRRTWRRGERTCTPFNHGGESKAVCISPPLERGRERREHREWREEQRDKNKKIIEEYD